jgi:hypothetical protein
MNDPTLSWNALLKTLTSEQQALLALYHELPPEQLLRHAQLMHHWEQAPPDRRALALQVLNDRLSDKDVALLLDKSTRQLRRYQAYQTAKQLRRQQRNRLPRGFKDRNGELEAFQEED